MFSDRSLFASLALMVALSTTTYPAVATDYPFRCDHTPEEHATALSNAVEILEKDGFKVEVGKHTYGHASEFSANPSTLYGFFRFGVSPLFTLDKSDAIVFYGCTPPLMRYFSYTPYVFTTPELNKTIMFASLQDPLSVLNMRTRDTPRFPYSSTTLVVMTASTRTDSAVRSAFEPGLESWAMNTLQVSDQLVTLGATPLAASGLMLLSRVAIYGNATECEAYTNSTFPVLKVSRSAASSGDLFDLPSLTSRFSGVSQDMLETTLAELTIAVVGNVTAKGYRVAYQSRMKRYPLNARQCIAKGTDCLGDCPDAAYFADLREFRLGSADSRDLFMVVGVNHRMLGSATYTNFGLDPFTAVTDDKFGDSAAQFLPSSPIIGQFFAYKVARKCGDDYYCLEVPTETVKPDEDVRFSGRVYLNPRTLTGPAYNETIPNYLLHFTAELV